MRSFLVYARAEPSVLSMPPLRGSAIRARNQWLAPLAKIFRRSAARLLKSRCRRIAHGDLVCRRAIASAAAGGAVGARVPGRGLRMSLKQAMDLFLNRPVHVIIDERSDEPGRRAGDD